MRPETEEQDNRNVMIAAKLATIPQAAGIRKEAQTKPLSDRGESRGRHGSHVIACHTHAYPHRCRPPL